MIAMKIIFALFIFKIVMSEDIQKSEGKNTDDNNTQEAENSSIFLKDKINSNVIVKTNTSSLNWPLGIVPYYIDTESYDNIISRRIRSAMDTIESSSCVVFKPFERKPRNIQETWLYFANPSKERECVHEPIYTDNGTIVIVFGYECLRRRDVLHTLLHALGFRDEVSHPQRDHYVRILWENLQPKYRSLFRIMFDDISHKTLVEYDPMSVMHFHDRAFSTNGGATIAPLIPGLKINPSDNLSQLDVMKLRLYFGAECNKRKVGDLLDTCKNILYENSNDGNDDENNIYKTVDEEDIDKEEQSDEDEHDNGNDSEDNTVDEEKID